MFVTLQIFFATRAVLKNGEYSRMFSSFEGLNGSGPFDGSRLKISRFDG